MFSQQELRKIVPQKEYFVGIDSDGCVFDTMDLKQKQFFIPKAIEHFGLSGISDLLTETWEFVTLFSRYRGTNRFLSMVITFDMLSEREEFSKCGFKLPDYSALKEWTGKETQLGNTALHRYLASNPDPFLEKVYHWSTEINREIRKKTGDNLLFHPAGDAVRQLSGLADLVVVSQTPVETLQNDWEVHGLSRYVRFIAGQEHGTKSEQLTMAARGKYPDNHLLMIGDSPGDLIAANSVNALFYPVIPGREEESWRQLIKEGLERFVSHRFAGEYQEKLKADFHDSLPEKPPWIL